MQLALQDHTKSVSSQRRSLPRWLYSRAFAERLSAPGRLWGDWHTVYWRPVFKIRTVIILAVRLCSRGLKLVVEYRRGGIKTATGAGSIKVGKEAAPAAINLAVQIYAAFIWTELCIYCSCQWGWAFCKTVKYDCKIWGLILEPAWIRLCL